MQSNVSGSSHITSAFQSIPETSQRGLLFRCPDEVLPRAIFLVSISVNVIKLRPEAFFLSFRIPILLFNISMCANQLSHWALQPQMLCQLRLNMREGQVKVRVCLCSSSSWSMGESKCEFSGFASSECSGFFTLTNPRVILNEDRTKHR